MSERLVAVIFVREIWSLFLLRLTCWNCAVDQIDIDDRKRDGQENDDEGNLKDDRFSLRKERP